ncbi:MAG: OBG GTPase family GTP-binding protein [Candidatus Micrarchaeia archaeon]
MPGLEEKLEQLRYEYSKTKYNKATNKHLGILRKKIARITKELSEKKGSGGIGFAVKKTGDATVALVGFPNAGKSSFLGMVTDAESKVADYAFTTLTVVPGMLIHNGAKIQILDVPGLIEGASIGKGGGRKIVSVIRVADLIVFMVDINAPDQIYKLLDELYSLDIRVNLTRPKIRVEKLKAGGINVESNKHKVPDKRSIIEILNEYKIFNANVIFHQDCTLEDLSDFLDDSITYVDAIVLLNKIDTVDKSYVLPLVSELEKTTQMKVVPISAGKGLNLEEAKNAIFHKLSIMRIYLKPKTGNPDLENPLILKKESTVLTAAKSLHTKKVNNLKYAYVSGKSVKFENQRVGKEHVLKDQDIITLIYEK